MFYYIIYHTKDGIAHIVAFKYLVSLFVDNFSLLVVYFIIFEKVLSDTVVVALYLHLSLFNSSCKHLVFNLLILRNSKCVEDIYKSLRSEKSHKIIFK